MQPDRVVALSEQLRQVHQGLRERLAGLRQQVATAAPDPGTGADPGPGADGLLPGRP